MAADDVIIVTGATGNLGSAVVRELDRRRVRVAAVDRQLAPLEALLAGSATPDRHIAIVEADLESAGAAEKIIDQATARLGPISGLVHTVGGFAAAPIDASDLAFWEQMFRLNVGTTVNMVRAVLPGLRAAGRGSIAVISAGAALRAPSGLAAYSAAKSGVIRLVESVADETKHEGVRINAILPSTIDTPQNRAAMPQADFASWVTPDEIARTIAFLMSDESSGITGAAIPVSGRT